MNVRKNKTKFSKLRLRNSIINNSPINNEKISSYFPKLSQENYTQPEDDDENVEENRSKSAPVLMEFNDTASDEKDFIKLKKPTRQLKLFMCEKSKKIKNDDIELAIALSRSVEEMQHPEQSTSSSAELLRKTLEQYGFNSKMMVKSNPKPPTKRKKSKFIRTVLFLRTEEDRTNIIQGKISDIMNTIEEYNDYVLKMEENEPKLEKNELISDKPASFMLRDMYDSESTLFKKCALDIRDDEVYFNNLVDPSEACKIGSLLRNWHKIPGREKTPPREYLKKKIEFTEHENKNSKVSVDGNQYSDQESLSIVKQNSFKEQVMSSQSCAQYFKENESQSDKKNNKRLLSENSFRSESPELFSDDDIIEKGYERNLNPEKCKTFVSPIKHYESFNDAVCFDISSSSDDLFESKVGEDKNNCIDLTQTSGSNDGNVKNEMSENVGNEEMGNCSYGIKSGVSDEIKIDFEESVIGIKKNYVNPEDSEINSEEMKIYSVETGNEDIREENISEVSEIKFVENNKKNKIDSEGIKINSKISKINFKNLKNSNEIKINLDGTKIKFTETNKYVRSKSFSDTKQNVRSENFQRSKSFSSTDTNCNQNLNENLSDMKKISDSKNVLDEIDEIIDCDNFEKSQNVFVEKKSDDTLQNCKDLILDHPELFSDTMTKKLLSSKNDVIIDLQTTRLCESESDNEVQEISNDKIIKNKQIMNQLTNIDLTLSSEDEQSNCLSPDCNKNENYLEEVSITRNSTGENISLQKLVLSSRRNLKSPVRDCVSFSKDLSVENSPSYRSPFKNVVSSPNSPNVFVLSDTENENQSDTNDSPQTTNKNEQTSIYKFNESCIKKKIPSPGCSKDQLNLSQSKKDEEIKLYKFNESCIKKKTLSFSSSEEEKVQNISKNILSIENISRENCSYHSVENEKIISYKFNELCIKRKTNSGEKIPSSEDLVSINNLSQTENLLSIDLSQPENLSIDSISSDEELNYSSNVSFMRKKKILNKSKRNLDENFVDIDQNIEDIQNYMDIDQNIDDIENFRDVEKENVNLIEQDYKKFIDLNLDEIESDPEENNPWAMDHFEYPHDVINEVDKPDHFSQNVVKNNVSVRYPSQGVSKNLEDKPKTDTPSKTIENIPSTSTQTPDNQLIIKTHDVTPIPNYDNMDTPQRNKELDRFGLKPMKKTKSVKILEYIYNATHPITSNDKKRHITEDESENVKRRKMDKKQKFVKISNSQVRRRQSQKPQNCIYSDIKIIGDEIANSENIEEMIFEKRYSSKIRMCRIPLHIVWHNFVSSQPELLENILLYEPLQIEEIHLKIKKLGYNFDIQDLITFLDKKCITIRINQNSRLKRKEDSSS